VALRLAPAPKKERNLKSRVIAKACFADGYLPSIRNEGKGSVQGPFSWQRESLTLNVSSNFEVSEGQSPAREAGCPAARAVVALSLPCLAMRRWKSQEGLCSKLPLWPPSKTLNSGAPIFKNEPRWEALFRRCNSQCCLLHAPANWIHELQVGPSSPLALWLWSAPPQPEGQRLVERVPGRAVIMLQASLCFQTALQTVVACPAGVSTPFATSVMKKVAIARRFH